MLLFFNNILYAFGLKLLKLGPQKCKSDDENFIEPFIKSVTLFIQLNSMYCFDLYLNILKFARLVYTLQVKKCSPLME